MSEYLKHLPEEQIKNTTIVYDNGCMLNKFALNRDKSAKICELIAEMDMRIDKMHFKNHVDKWCQLHCNPFTCDAINNANTEACEQLFAWLSGFSYILRYMSANAFFFAVLDLLDMRNHVIYAECC